MQKQFTVFTSLFLLFFSSNSQALDLTLTIQPILPKADIIRAYTPLAEYLSSETGHKIEIRAHRNFITYWADMRRLRGFDLVLDAAHFTDYRVQKNNYKVLAKLPESVSFSVVTHEDELVLDNEELILKRVATMVSPSVGALRLLDMFKDPMHQPHFVYAKNASDAAKMVMDKKVTASIIPTAMVSSFENLSTVMTTDSLPHMGFSASPNVPEEIREAIRKALLEAKDTTKGKELLAKLNFTAFDPADEKVYKGYAKLLKDVLGY